MADYIINVSPCFQKSERLKKVSQCLTSNNFAKSTPVRYDLNEKNLYAILQE